MNFIKLSKKKGEFFLDNYEEIKLPPGAVADGKAENFKAVASAISSLRQKYGIKFARVVLPEEEQDIFTDYLDDWKEALNGTGVYVQSYEPLGQALLRAVIKKGDRGTYMVVNVNEGSTDVFVADQGRVVLGSVLDTGGEMLVRIAEKESIRRSSGLSRSVVVAEISSSLIGGITILREELSKIFMNWNNLRYEDGSRMPEIRKIILCGKSAHLKGLDEFLSVSFKIKAELANVWTNVFDPAERVPDLTFRESLSYAGAIGAALK